MYTHGEQKYSSPTKHQDFTVILPVTCKFPIVYIDASIQYILTVDQEDQHTKEAGDTDHQTEADDPPHPQVEPLDQVTAQKRAPTSCRYSSVTYEDTT